LVRVGIQTRAHPLQWVGLEMSGLHLLLITFATEQKVKPEFTQHGFLPDQDPVRSFPHGSDLAVLDEWGHDLPSRLEDRGFRQMARGLKIPEWPENEARPESLPYLRLYYVRLGFLASGYINQVSEPPAMLLPQNIAIPFNKACRLLGRPPILSYDGYALYNWKRFDLAGPIELGNIDTLQNFVHMYDEHWFILIHVEIEALGSGVLSAIDRAGRAVENQDAAGVNEALADLTQTLWKQIAVLRRIPEKMDPALYYKTFRPYIRFFENVVYEGVASSPMTFRGETGAQSSLMPTLVAFMKIPHQASALTDHLADMRRFMPPEHRALIEEVQQMPSVRDLADKEPYNTVLEAMATFREIHYGWAHEYIQKRTTDPRGTGGTPYLQWLQQLVNETRAHQLP
jgi:indoleamine 2,3-dioxygenase